MQTFFHFEYDHFLGLRRLVLGADPCVSKGVCIQPLLLGNHQSTGISEYCPHLHQGKAWMGRLHSLLGQALACDECGLQHADMPCEHSLRETTPTPWHFVVLFPPG